MGRSGGHHPDYEPDIPLTTAQMRALVALYREKLATFRHAAWVLPSGTLITEATFDNLFERRLTRTIYVGAGRGRPGAHTGRLTQVGTIVALSVAEHIASIDRTDEGLSYHERRAALIGEIIS
ncbi:MAG: hypothetical protein AB7U62_04130 [Pseudolabrys sp.]